MIIEKDEYIHCRILSKKNLNEVSSNEDVNVFVGEIGDITPSSILLSECLSLDEIERANKFKIESVRNTYVLAHAFLRKKLADELGVKPPDVPIVIDKYGKPYLESNTLSFNISHTRKSFAIVIARKLSVGIDIEEIKENIDFRTVMESYYHENEINAIKNAIPEEKIELFYKFWTRKEAFLKAIGIGLVNSLNEIDMSNVYSEVDEEFFPIKLSGGQCNYFIYTRRFGKAFLSISLSIPRKLLLLQLVSLILISQICML